jgi:CheY-like chemotaxis protein
MKQILVVDDDSTIREFVQHVLRKEGYDVTVMHDGEQVLTYLQTGAIPDLVLSDLHMPNVCGFKLTQTIKANAATRQVPVIVMSSHSDPQAYSAVFGAGAEDFLVKPFNRVNLLTAVNNHLKPEHRVTHASVATVREAFI